MLKIHVTGTSRWRGREVAIVKLIYNIRRILRAEKPCNAAMKNNAVTRSKRNLCRNRNSGARGVRPGLAEPLACELFVLASDCVK